MRSFMKKKLLTQGFELDDIESGSVISFSRYIPGAEVIQASDDMMEHDNDLEAAECRNALCGTGYVTFDMLVPEVFPTAEAYLADTPEEKKILSRGLLGFMSLHPDKKDAIEKAIAMVS